MKKHEDVFLVDHLWTFKQRDAVKALKTNDKLLERMLNIIKYQEEKLDLPTNPYAKVRPSFIDYVKTFHDETTVYDLDDYGIKSLSHIPFSKRTEEISLFGNQIENPGEISGLVEQLPYLKALWVNGNPVVENCVNFNNIGEYF